MRGASNTSRFRGYGAEHHDHDSQTSHTRLPVLPAKHSKTRTSKPAVLHKGQQYTQPSPRRVLPNGSGPDKWMSVSTDYVPAGTHPSDHSSRMLASRNRSSVACSATGIRRPHNERPIDPLNIQIKKQPNLSTERISQSYTVRPIIPAKKAELLPVARAMHREQFAPRVKKLFDPEREAALEAIKSGLYIGWRCPEYNWDCIRVGSQSRCFCDHALSNHQTYTGSSDKLSCLLEGCDCKVFTFIPGRPEDIGEWWLQKRPGFDISAWRVKCRCKHTHVQHTPNHPRKCTVRGCSCFTFDSNFLCAACDKHWEQHQTCFDTADTRMKKGLPCGQNFVPFHELPDLRNIVLTGKEDDDSMYEALASGPYAIPNHSPSRLALQLRGDSSVRKR